MEVTMSRETDWMVFEKAVEVTASAVRGTAGGSQPASYVAEVFREIHKALKETAETMVPKDTKAGF
jgi:hypothetical protein